VLAATDTDPGQITHEVEKLAALHIDFYQGSLSQPASPAAEIARRIAAELK